MENQVNLDATKYDEFLRVLLILKDICNDVDIREGFIRQRTNDSATVFEIDLTSIISNMNLPISELKNKLDIFKCFSGEEVSISTTDDCFIIADQYSMLKIKNPILEFMDNNATLFEKRVKKSKIIETHGDLHSGNIFVTPKDTFIFDAIEFNPGINTTDVAAEIAFLCMDLEFLGRYDLSKAFSDKYILESNDKEILKLLPFYKGYRACVRAKVNGYNAAVDNAAKELTIKYFYLALKYMEEL